MQNRSAALGVPASTLESNIKALKIDERRFKSASPLVSLARAVPSAVLAKVRAF